MINPIQQNYIQENSEVNVNIADFRIIPQQPGLT